MIPVDLFDYAQQKALDEEGPLAFRMRPKTIEEFAGQEHLVAPGRLLHAALKADKPFSAIFYGHPGTGKTTLAKIIAYSSQAVFVQVDATSTGVGELRKVLQRPGSVQNITARKQFFLLMKSIVLTRHSRMCSYRLWSRVL